MRTPGLRTSRCIPRARTRTDSASAPSISTTPKKVQLRAGFLHHSNASPPQFVTPLLPEAARNEFTLGTGIALSSHLHADLAYQYIRQNDRRGTINLAAGNTGLYKFSAHLFGAGIALTF